MVPAHTQYRTAEECDIKHKDVVGMEYYKTFHNSLKKQVAILTTFVSIILTCTAWSVYAAYIAENAATEASYQVTIHEARQSEVEKNIQDSLSRIEKSNNSLYVELRQQRDMIENIYINGIKNKPTP